MTASTCNKFATFNNKIEHYFAPARKPRLMQRAKRCLFGPVDHVFNESWLSDQLTKQIINDSIKYNFDFSEGQLPELRGLNPPVPMRPIKRRTTFDFNENSSQYYFEPIEPDRKDNANLLPNNIDNKKVAMKQSLLTDFMQSKKHIDTPSIKTAGERPTKKPKLTDCSS